MRKCFALLSVVVMTCASYSADKTFSEHGVTFNHAAAIDVSAYPKKDKSGVLIVLSNARGTVTGAIATIKPAVPEGPANDEQLQIEGALGGIAPNAWKPIKRKIGAVEHEGKVGTGSRTTVECYAVKLGNQTLQIVLRADKGAEKEAEAAFKTIMESLK